MSRRFQLGAFPSGTIMAFQNTVAPVGWVKETAHDDKAMRVVTGTPSSGGSVAFSTVFGLTATGTYTLLDADLSSHLHGAGTLKGFIRDAVGTAGAAASMNSGGAASQTIGGSTASLGSDTGHAHAIDLQVNYVDLILARRG